MITTNQYEIIKPATDLLVYSMVGGEISRMLLCELTARKYGLEYNKDGLKCFAQVWWKVVSDRRINNSNNDAQVSIKNSRRFPYERLDLQPLRLDFNPEHELLEEKLQTLLENYSRVMKNYLVLDLIDYLERQIYGARTITRIRQINSRGPLDLSIKAFVIFETNPALALSHEQN